MRRCGFRWRSETLAPPRPTSFRPLPFQVLRRNLCSESAEFVLVCLDFRECGFTQPSKGADTDRSCLGLMRPRRRCVSRAQYMPCPLSFSLVLCFVCLCLFLPIGRDLPPSLSISACLSVCLSVCVSGWLSIPPLFRCPSVLCLVLVPRLIASSVFCGTSP